MEWITIEEYCTSHNTEVSFVDALEENGLIEVIKIEEERCIRYDQLDQLESFTRLHLELNINVEGIETIHHLLQRIRDMQQHIQFLENKLRHYEAGA
jgi:hypothetical protein